MKTKLNSVLRGWVTLALLLALATAVRAMSPAPAPGAAYPGVLTIKVDASNVGQGIFMVHQQWPVKPGRLRLSYPRWLPGWHGPYGQVSEIAGLTMRVGARRLDWHRLPDDPWTFEVEVPPGATLLDVHYQWLGADKAAAAQPLMSRQALGLTWPALVLYPSGHAHAAVTVQAKLKLPAGWGWGSALRATGEEQGWITFEPQDLETVMDSPVYAGPGYQRFELDPPGTAQPVVMHLFSDPAAAKPGEAQIEAHRRLLQQAHKLFGWRPWRHYDLLVANGKGFPFNGLEHHESSENSFDGHYFDDWATAARLRDIVPHELVHAWNGKARRPADLWAGDMNTPTRNSLLWVYEGLTTYLGVVLAGRAGILTHEQVQRQWVRSSAYFEALPGRQWRSLQDTTFDPAQARNAAGGAAWGDWTRGFDYYGEAAMLIWLDADTLIRELSGERRSLDDFAREFFAGGAGDKSVRLYSFEDVVAALNRVQPHDWRRFLRERLDRTGASVPLDGLTRAGWRVDWADQRSAMDLASLSPEKPALQLNYSLGLVLAPDGKVTDLAWAAPAFCAGMSGEDTVVAVHSQAYSAERMEAAMRANREGAKPVELLLRRDDDYRSLTLDVRGGPRYPKPARIEGSPDRLSQILTPR